MTDKENKWIKFYPSLELPKERVSIAYATHDERGYRFAYGYFQFYNGTCGCFWKDGNEQPKVVKAEDIKYWMPVPSLDVQEEPVSEDLDIAIGEYCSNPDNFITYIDVAFAYRSEQKDDIPLIIKAIKFGANWQKTKDQETIETAIHHAYHNGKLEMKEQMMAKAVDGDITFDYYGDDDKTYGCIAHDSFCLEDLGLKDRDKVKVIVIKQQ